MISLDSEVDIERSESRFGAVTRLEAMYMYTTASAYPCNSHIRKFESNRTELKWNNEISEWNILKEQKRKEMEHHRRAREQVRIAEV